MSELAPALASALLHSLWQNALLAATAMAVLEAMARSSATLRHGVGMAFLILMVLVPLAQFLGYWSDGLVDQDALPTLAGFGAALRKWSAQVGLIAVWAWGAGAIFLLARRGLAVRAVTTMERAPFVALPAPLLRRLDDLRCALGGAHAVAARVSNNVLVPCVTGFLSPIVWLPAQVITGLTPSQIEAILAHELAHVARKDWLWNALQSVIECLFFFNPAVWRLSRRVRQERERACDELAVRACGDAVVLAEALTTLERSRRSVPQLSLAANGGALLSRVRWLLGESRPRRAAPPIFAATVAATALVLGLAGAIGGHPPDLIVQMSAPGSLGPGDYVQISSHDRSGERFYRLSFGADGRTREVYRVDGQLRQIDPGARRWIDGVLGARAPTAADAAAEAN